MRLKKYGYWIKIMKYLDEKRDSSPNHLRRESHFLASSSFKDQHCLYGSFLLRPIFT
jgi:hypothetical protein